MKDIVDFPGLRGVVLPDLPDLPDLRDPRHASRVPGNAEHGLSRHHVLEVGTTNAYRTAAAHALAVDLPARPGATTLAVFGTCHQAAHEVRDAART
ncbi:hypothetical protein [Streptomyces sp. NPDC005303]|uniref:hypothetical protein n=1 Tax=Streptomyces sp. NPDC005303 TaxID=3155713 RepID=UPI0033A84A4E